MQLEGKAAIVTGGAQGIGKGVATAFVKAGAKVLIVDREDALGRETAKELEQWGTIAFLQADLMDRASLPSVVETAIDAFGRLDTLVNVAQASRVVSLMETKPEDIDLTMGSGFWASFLLMQAAYPHLVACKGSVINFGSRAGILGEPLMACYAAAKEAVRALSKVASAEWGKDGVRVNVICPFANSPGVQKWAEAYPEDYQAALRTVPLGRLGDCEQDIGGAAVFLASDNARYITGQTLMVDGGNARLF